MDMLVTQTDEILSELLDSYSKNNKPIKVDFREIVHHLKYGERATHLIHPYPAKLLSHIPFFFINNQLLTKEHSVVLDPFCGSGTVVLEANISGRNAVGMDCNPLAVLISRVKTSKINVTKANIALKKILKNHGNVKPHIPSVVNIDYWYSKKNKNGLGKLKTQIESIRNNDISLFMQVCLSVCARKLSYADPGVSVPVKLDINKKNINQDRKIYIKTIIEKIDNTKPIDLFEKIVLQNINRMENFAQLCRTRNKTEIFLSDVLNMDEELKKSYQNNVDLIITSPPYAGAQKYVRATSLSLGWLEMAGENELRPIESKTIGREHYTKKEYLDLMPSTILKANSVLKKIYQVNPLRAHIASNYLLEMEAAIKNINRVLKKGGYLVLIIANNEVCGMQFNTKEYIKEIIKRNNLSLILELQDDIKSRGLMTKRNKTASVIHSESVLVFSK